MKRGDVVVLQFPFADGGRGKNRPALVIQNNSDNRRLSNCVVAMISGNIQHASELTQVLVDPKTQAGSSSGLHGPSVVKCCNLFTIRQQDVLRTIGHLSDDLLSEVGVALKVALDLN
jgi:mRNA interferase MazF